MDKDQLKIDGETKLFTKGEIEITEKGGMRVIASTSVTDRHGEIVDVKGWDLKAFKKNPVMQWAHDAYIPAVSTAKNLKIEKVNGKDSLTFEPVFHEITEAGSAMKALVEAGIIKAVSVGFKPLDWEFDDDDKLKFTKQELLEISWVNVPANQEALAMATKAMEKSGVSSDMINSFRQAAFKAPKKSDDDRDKVIAELQKTVLKQGEVISDLVKGVKHLNPAVDKKKAIAVRLTLAKVVARASDTILQGKPTGKNATLVKVIKRASDSLITDAKQELKDNG